MEVRACRGCGKLYNYLGANTPACPSCMAAMEEKFQKCKEYIRDNPRANIQQVSDDNEVSVKMIKQWIREERLSFAEDSCVGIECESCGAIIRTGRYCNICKVKFQQSVQQAIKKPFVETLEQRKRSADGKMRYLDN